MSVEHGRICEYYSDEDKGWHRLKYYSNVYPKAYLNDSEYSIDSPIDYIISENGNKYCNGSMIADCNHSLAEIIKRIGHERPVDADYPILEDTYSYYTVCLSDLYVYGETLRAEFMKGLVGMIENHKYSMISKKLNSIMEKLNIPIDTEVSEFDLEEDKYYESDLADYIEEYSWDYINVLGEAIMWHELVCSVTHQNVKMDKIRLTVFNF